MNFAGNYAVEFRVFDNGVAYRFITDKKGENIVMGEDFVLNFPANYKAHLSQPNGFKTSYEYPYTHVNTEEYNLFSPKYHWNSEKTVTAVSRF